MSADGELTDAVKALAGQAGFAAAAIAPAGPVHGLERFNDWLARGCQAEMAYLARDASRRFRPDLLVEGSRSVICLAAGYAPPGGGAAGSAVARYALGRDYHKVLKRRCRLLMDRIADLEKGFQGRAFVDSGSLAERSLAAAAGLGWIGRNGCLVVPAMGSYVVLCEIICNLPLRPDAPLAGGCGDCRACLEACPTRAFVADGLLDARRCISYLTVEHRGRIDPELLPLMGTRVFGCDACQEACPYNRGVPAGDAELTCPAGQACRPELAEILRWGECEWDAATRGRARRRASLRMWVRNAVIAAGNSEDASLRPLLLDLRGRAGEDISLIDWALARLAG